MGLPLLTVGGLLTAIVSGTLTILDIANDNEMSAVMREEFGDEWQSAIAGLEQTLEGMPSFQYEGQIFGPAAGQFPNMPVAGSGGLTENQVLANLGLTPPPGSAFGDGIFNLDELFNVGQAEQDYFNQNYPTDLSLPNVDIGLDETMGDISSLLGGAREGIGTAEQQALARSGGGLAGGLSQLGAASQAIGGLRTGALTNIEEILGGAKISPEQLLEGVEMPETDLSEVLSGRLAGIGAASRSRQELQQQELAAGGAAVGGLENLAAQGRSLGFEEGAQRGLEGSVATAQTRGEELAAQQFVSNLQGQAASTSAQIGSTLAQAQAAAETSLTGQAMGAEQAFGLAGADLQKQFGLTDINTINRAAEAIAGLTAQEAAGLLQAEGIELNLEQLNNLRDFSNITTTLGRYGEGARVAAGPERDELARFGVALTGWLTNLGIEGEVASQIINAVLGMGGINQPFMGNTITDWMSIANTGTGMVRDWTLPYWQAPKGP